MTLAVAEIHDGGISLVADTKITYSDDPTRTTRELYAGVPKLAILRDDLCVAYAGNDGVGTLEFLINHRHATVDALTERLAARAHASHVIASLEGPTLVTIRRGTVEPRGGVARTWVGDQAAFEVFQQRAGEWPESIDTGFRLLSSLQFLIHFKVVESVGGLHTRVATTLDGFRYCADQATVGPERLETTKIERLDDGVTLSARVPHGGDVGSMSLLCAVGRPPTFGALAYLIPEAQLGIVFCHDAPWLPTQVQASTLPELVETARVELGQTLWVPT